MSALFSESDIKCDIMECPLRANSGQYLTATLDKLLRRGRHSLFQLIENPAPQLRRIAFGDVDFARQRSQCAILRVEQPIENGPFSTHIKQMTDEYWKSPETAADYAVRYTFAQLLDWSPESLLAYLTEKADRGEIDRDYARRAIKDAARTWYGMNDAKRDLGIADIKIEKSPHKEGKPRTKADD